MIDFESPTYVRAAIYSAQETVNRLTDTINEQTDMGTPKRKAQIFRRRRLVSSIRELKLLESNLQLPES